VCKYMYVYVYVYIYIYMCIYPVDDVNVDICINSYAHHVHICAYVCYNENSVCLSLTHITWFTHKFSPSVESNLRLFLLAGLSRNQGSGVRLFMQWVMPNLPFGVSKSSSCCFVASAGFFSSST